MITKPFTTVRRFAFSLTLLLATTPLAVPAFAQGGGTFPPGTLTLARDPNDPSALLNQYLRQLSTSPRDLNALIGAGKAALAMGDANAGIGFFGRAEEVAPRDGRVKAGLAAAAVQQEQPKQALQLFDAAIAAGVPVSAIGGDRGLAYDLRGQNRLAQSDYRAALAVKPDDETVRRLALSTAIGGDRAGAMAILDPLLRRQDKAAWRAATFVLAMTGDAPGAIKRANQLMIPTQAAAMTPYLQRLGSLTPAEKAAAVHFGRFPAAGRPAATQVATATRGATAPTSVAAPLVVAGHTAEPAREAASNRAAVPAPTTNSAAALNRAAAARGVAPVAGGTMTASAPVARAAAPMASPTLAMAATAVPPAVATATGGSAPVSGPAIPDAGPIGEAAVPVVGTDSAAPTQAAPVPQGARGASMPSDTVRMVTAVPTPAPVVARTPVPVAPVVTKPAAAAAKAVPVRVAPVVVEAGPVLTPAEKSRLGIRTKGPVAVASLTKMQKTKLEATEVVPVLTAAEKTRLGIRTKGPVTVASLTKVQKAKLDAGDAETAALLTVADKAKLGIKTKGAVTVASLTKAQKAKLDVADADDAVVLTAAEKTRLGIRTKGAVTVASLTKTQKAKLDAGDAEAAPVLTAAEKTKLGIKTKGAVTVASLTKAQKAKLDAGNVDDAPVLTAAEKTKLGIRTKGAVVVASLTKAQKAKLDAADKAPAKAASRQPERHWVQVAGGANKATLPQAWATVKGKYPALLGGRTPHTTPLRATNRLLVGPFKSDDEAQAFVNKAGGAGLNAFTYTSPAGVAVETVPGK